MNNALNQDDVYSSPPSRVLIERTSRFNITNFLDVGAGPGNTLKEFQQIHPYASRAAITCSKKESEELKKPTKETFIFNLHKLNDLRKCQGAGLANLKYDLILLSHVLEHTQNPLDELNGICIL